MAYGDGPDMTMSADLGGLSLPDSLDAGQARFESAPTYSELRAEGAAWAREDEAGEALAQTLLDLEPLMERSYLLGQPNLAGMGVGAWGLAVAEPEAAPAAAARRRQRMVRGASLLGGLIEAEEEEAISPAAAARGADLLDGMARLDAARLALPEDAPEVVVAGMLAMRADLSSRLSREARQDPALSRALAQGTGRMERLRRLAGQTPVAPIVVTLPAPADSIYRRPLDVAMAEESPLAGPLGTPPETIYAEAPAKAAPVDPTLAKLARLAGLPAAAASAEPPKPPPPPKRKARGSEGVPQRPRSMAPIRIGRVDVSPLKGPGAAHGAAVLNAALAALPSTLEAHLRRDPARAAQISGSAGRVALPVDLPARGDAAMQGRVVADRIADTLVRAGHGQVETLSLGARTTGSTGADQGALLSQIGAGNAEGVAKLLSGERKTLDQATQDRLARFFGSEFKDVMVFAGPMAGALARSMSAEALTHGQMMFFDPKHFRLDTAGGEALLAHEMAHTQQADSRGVAMKEAEALAVEASYLDWLQPGGAPLAEEMLDPTGISAAAATDVGAGMHRAASDRTIEKSEGPRANVAKFEARVGQVLERVEELLRRELEWEGARTGELDDFSGPI